MNINHKKSAAFYLSFPMVDSTNPETFATGLTPTDTAYSKDGAGAWTTLAITDTAAEIASTGIYEIDLTAAEMNHDKVLIKFTSAGAADTFFLFDMTTNDVDDLATATALATVDTEVGNMQTDVTAVLADTSELQGDWVNGGSRWDMVILGYSLVPEAVLPPIY